MLKTFPVLLYIFHFVTAVKAGAKIRLLESYSSHIYSDDYLVPWEDYFFSKFEVSGNDTHFTYNLFDGPLWEYTPLGSPLVIHCELSDDPITGFCENLAHYTENRCLCEEMGGHVYHISVNLTIASAQFSQMPFKACWSDRENPINVVLSLPRVKDPSSPASTTKPTTGLKQGAESQPLEMVPSSANSLSTPLIVSSAISIIIADLFYR